MVSSTKRSSSETYALATFSGAEGSWSELRFGQHGKAHDRPAVDEIGGRTRPRDELQEDVVERVEGMKMGVATALGDEDMSVEVEEGDDRLQYMSVARGCVDGTGFVMQARWFVCEAPRQEVEHSRQGRRR